MYSANQMGDFGCGFFMVGRRSSPASVLLLFLAFGVVGLRVLKCVRALIAKSRVLRDLLCKDECFKEPRISSKPNGDHHLERDEFHEVKEKFEEEEDQCLEEERDDGDEFDGVKEGIEEEELNVIALREMVKAERRRADAALRDLDKERMAAASSAEEAMAMIFRLQNDKSSLQIQLNQLRRSVEEKQVYDQQLIHSLQWTLMQYEDETSAMEGELELCNKRLDVYEHDHITENFTSPCTPYLSQSRSPCKLQDLRIGSLD